MKLGYWACIHNVLRLQHFHYTTIERENANHGVSVEIMWLRGEEQNGPKLISTMLFRIWAPLLIIPWNKEENTHYFRRLIPDHIAIAVFITCYMFGIVMHSHVRCFSPECIFKRRSKNCIRSKGIMQWLLYLHNVSKRVRSNQPFELYDVLTAHKHKFPSSVMLFCVVVASVPVACC